MELLYLYIKDDGKNIENCEFNFSPQYRFHYHKDTEYLECRKVENYITDFWEAPNISNITAIIGKNGSGKSNLIEFIIRFCASSNGLNGYNQGVILVYRKDGQLFIDSGNIKYDYPFKPKHYIQHPLNKHNENIETKIIYFSPHTEKFVLNGLGKGLLVDDISNSGILRSDAFRRGDRKFNFTDLEYLQMLDSLRHLWLFKYLSQQQSNFSLKIPHTLNFKLNAPDSKQNYEDSIYQKLFNVAEKENLTFEEHIQNRLLNQIYPDKKHVALGNTDSFEDFIGDDYYGRFYKSLIALDKLGKVSYKKGPYALGPYNYHFDFSIKTKDLNDDLLKGLYYWHFESEVYYGISTLELMYSMNDKVSWEWCGISSGELSYYNLFSRLLESYELEKQTFYGRKQTKNIILLFDEPETSFHPEWQRRFLKELIEFIKNIFKDYKVQVIIASHSPILVSDFPTNNIIFLDKDEETGNCKVVDSISQESTFAANIHSLYQNSFFLNGLPIGEFAKFKINKMLKELKDGVASKELYLQIQIIGEPLIRDQLMKLYNQNHPFNIEERISILESELEELKKQKGND